MLLSEDEAWQFAMAWQDELQGRVKLVTDPNAMLENGFDIVESYEWIQIDFAGSWLDGIAPVDNARRLAASVRVASIVWYVLSRCPGYGRVENPVFWKRVMSELNLVKHPVHDPGYVDAPVTKYFQSVSDSIRFFDHPDHSFPSLLLQLKVSELFSQGHRRISDRSITQVLSGHLIYSTGHEEREAKLHAIVEYLKSYLPPNATIEDGIIPVSLNVNDRSLDAGLPLRNKPMLNTLPSFALSTSPYSHISHHRRGLSRLQFNTLFGQLPTSKSIRSVTFDTLDQPTGDTFRDFNKKDYQALGEALFHPDSATSTWESLSIDLASVTEEKWAILKATSKTNTANSRLPLPAPCVRHLRVCPTVYQLTMNVESVLRLLSVLGSSLVTLDVAKCSAFDSGQAKQLLHYCPNLRSLSINHDGSVWSDATVKSPRLERLHLHLDSRVQSVASFCDEALQTALCDLEVLRVSTHYTSFEKSRDVVLCLLEKLQCLSHFHWINYSAGYRLRHNMPNKVIPYDESRERTMWKLSGGGQIALSRCVTHRLPSMALSRRVAFLSALYTEHSSISVTTDVGQHVARNVMALATPRVPRELCIDE